MLSTCGDVDRVLPPRSAADGRQRQPTVCTQYEHSMYTVKTLERSLLKRIVSIGKQTQLLPDSGSALLTC